MSVPKQTILQTKVIPEEQILKLLTEQARNTLEANGLGSRLPEVTFELNMPTIDINNPETKYESSWELK